MEYFRDGLRISQGVPLPLIAALVGATIVGISLLVCSPIWKGGQYLLTRHSSTSLYSLLPQYHALPSDQRRRTGRSNLASTRVKLDHYLAGKMDTMPRKRPHGVMGTLRKNIFKSRKPRSLCHSLYQRSMRRKDWGLC